jgi:UDP-glucose 4-epimerase
MKNKRSLVTGAAGFLGSHLVDQLIKLDHDVVAIDILPIEKWENLRHWEGSPKLFKISKDITQIKPNGDDLGEIDYIFHLAGKEGPTQSLIDPTTFFNTNVIGTLKALELARNLRPSKFVFASSFDIYGKANTPTLETDDLAPTNPSALSKKNAEELVFHWSKVFDFEATALRIFEAYGPRCKDAENFGSGFGAWMNQIQNQQPLTFCGEKGKLVDFIYCTDVANAFVTAATQGKNGEAYNIGSGKPHSYEEVATLLKASHYEVTLSAAHSSDVWADISKFQFDSNWQPRVPLSNGFEFSLEDSEQWKGTKKWNSKDLHHFLEPWTKISN